VIWRWALLVGWFLVGVAGCGQVTATDVNGLVTRGPAVDASPPDEANEGPTADATTDGAGADARAEASAPDVGPPNTCPDPCPRCFDPMATLRIVECRPGCGTCIEKNGQIPVDACWADGWFRCVHGCDECR